MNHKNKIAKYSLFILAIGLIAAGCKKLDRPPLGDYPKDANPPGGPLKFYAAFDGTTTNPLMNAVDSIRANFPSSNPLVAVDGVEGKAIGGVDQKAILYPSANDFDKATSFTISFWEKNRFQPEDRLNLCFLLLQKIIGTKADFLCWLIMMAQVQLPIQQQFRLRLRTIGS